MAKKDKKKQRIATSVILFCCVFFVADLIYKTVNNISYANREKCFFYRNMPRWAFLIFEYFFELIVIVIVGILLAVILEKLFTKYTRFYPKNPFTAFVYASILPVCACTVIPLIKYMKEKLPMRTIITFIVAAPLLSPYIIMLSLTVIGVKYTILRIISSLILAVTSGFVVEAFHDDKKKLGKVTAANCKKCLVMEKNVFLETFSVFMSVLPYLLIAAIMGLTLELFVSGDTIKSLIKFESPSSMLVLVLIGIPIYLCNGTEVFFLRPLFHLPEFPLGTAVAFSLASTAICITSFFMLLKFLGRKLTFILLAHIFIVTLIIGYLINLL